MRAFVALVPPLAAVAPVRELVDRLRPGERSEAAQPRYAGLGWVAPERWHVTLAFLRDVAEPKLARLEPRLAMVAAGGAPLTLRVAGGGAFPNPRRPRVFWAGLSGDLDGLEGLARNVSEAARQSRIALDATPFRAHLTLARVRRRDFDLGPELVGELAAASGPEWTAGELVLMRSHLGPHPRYEPLATWPLG